MNTSAELKLNSLKLEVVSRCGKRLERATVSGKYNDPSPVFGVTSIMKSKYGL